MRTCWRVRCEPSQPIRRNADHRAALRGLPLSLGPALRPPPPRRLAGGSRDRPDARLTIGPTLGPISGKPPAPNHQRNIGALIGSVLGNWSRGIWDRRAIACPTLRSSPLRARCCTTERAESQWLGELPRQPLAFRNAGQDRREVLLRGPGGTSIVVGRDVGHAMYRLTETLVQLIAIGAAVLFLGLIGGWWLAGKIIQPIRQISETAGHITAQSLSGRIDTAKMDSELQSLGSTLNSMLERLEASFERQNQFTADASHELRTPISVLLSHCELALSRQRSGDEYRNTIATCQSAAERMRSLVDGLLTLARADAGQMELQLAEVDLQTLAAQAVSLFTPLAHERQVTLNLQGESTLCSADAVRISQVVANLLHNAILYNRPNGSVTISTLPEAGCAVLRVVDTGRGIPPESLPHVFDRFYRVDHSRSRQVEDQRRSGSGLGLAICKSIVDAHHGSLTVTSQVDVGSQFELRLPSVRELMSLASTDGKAGARM